MTTGTTPAGTNWAGNLTYRAARVHHPESVAEVQEVVARSQRVKALGSRHCFNDIADTPADSDRHAGTDPYIRATGSLSTR